MAAVEKSSASADKTQVSPIQNNFRLKWNFGEILAVIREMAVNKMRPPARSEIQDEVGEDGIRVIMREFSGAGSPIDNAMERARVVLPKILERATGAAREKLLGELKDVLLSDLREHSVRHGGRLSAQTINEDLLMYPSYIYDQVFGSLKNAQALLAGTATDEFVAKPTPDKKLKEIVIPCTRFEHINPTFEELINLFSQDNTEELSLLVAHRWRMRSVSIEHKVEAQTVLLYKRGPRDTATLEGLAVQSIADFRASTGLNYRWGAVKLTVDGETVVAVDALDKLDAPGASDLTNAWASTPKTRIGEELARKKTAKASAELAQFRHSITSQASAAVKRSPAATLEELGKIFGQDPLLTAIFDKVLEKQRNPHEKFPSSVKLATNLAGRKLSHKEVGEAHHLYSRVRDIVASASDITTIQPEAEKKAASAEHSGGAVFAPEIDETVAKKAQGTGQEGLLADSLPNARHETILPDIGPLSTSLPIADGICSWQENFPAISKSFPWIQNPPSVLIPVIDSKGAASNDEVVSLPNDVNATASYGTEELTKSGDGYLNQAMYVVVGAFVVWAVWPGIVATASAAGAYAGGTEIIFAGARLAGAFAL